ncbi:MAG: hypothetical protein ACRCX2_24240 [Paraclostridium sp.]
MSKNELICLYAATQFSRQELIKLMAKQSYKLGDVKSNNHLHRYATSHRCARKDKRLKVHHTINKRLHLAYIFQNQLERNKNYDLLDAISGVSIDKDEVYDYMHCYSPGHVNIDKNAKETSCYYFVDKDKSTLKKYCEDKNLDKHSEAVYITNILKKIGGKTNDKKRISSYN